VKTNRRGSTLLEVMTAGAVLLIGLAGVLQLIIFSSNGSRRGAQWVSSSYAAQDVLYEFIGNGFDGGGLVVGTFDAGLLIEGGRRTERTVVVTNVTAATGYPALEVEATVRWRAGGPDSTPRQVRARAIVSATP